ncbi:MAG: site-2 protease family protein [Fimbriimonadaceae bacterium]|jgi:regulator of sigma E protease|nr:site-2 protease family protein [Fimbriimonadaceae bacterium]
MENLITVWEWIRGGLVFMAVLTVLVFVHELGHYWVARLCGMHVEAFAVMMGGVRKTKLDEYLEKPLPPTYPLWLTALGAVALVYVGSFERQAWALYLGMAVLGVLIPVAIGSRLATLYHLSRSYWLGTFGKSYGGAVVIILIAMGGRPTLLGLLSILMAASLVALLILYYFPVSQKAEDAPFGMGSLQLGDGRTVPVRFRPVWHVTNKQGTEFSLLLLPLGGFAKMRGMHPKADGSEVHIEGGFYNRPPWQRLLVLFAGPLFSILFGIALMASHYAIAGAPTATTKVQESAPLTPAYVAGIRTGDQIISVNGQPITKGVDFLRAVRFSYDITESARTPKPVDVVWQRGEERFSASITPVITDAPIYVVDETQINLRRKYVARVGIRFETLNQPLAWNDAISRSVAEPFRMVNNLGAMATNVDTMRENLGGMTGVAAVSRDVANTGFWPVVLLAGLISISLGIMNLLPVPPMDGGQMVIAFVEMLRGGKRLSLGLQNAVTNFGMVFILIIAVLGLTLDIGRITGNSGGRSGLGTSIPIAPRDGEPAKNLSAKEFSDLIRKQEESKAKEG